MTGQRAAIPSYCCIALVERCFLRCRMCYKWKNDPQERDPAEPSVDQWKAFIRSLRDIVPDSFQINFAGGEPLLRPETLELAAFVHELGMRAHLASNGYLIDENIAAAIGRAGLYSVCLSLDGAQESTHDFLRGIPGAYKRVLRAMRLIRKYAPDTLIMISGVICACNLDEIDDLVRWADITELVDSIIFQAVTQPFSTPEDEYWYTRDEYRGLWPVSPAQVNDALDRLLAIKDGNPETKLQQSRAQLNVFKRYFANPHDFLKVARCHIDDKVLNVTPAGDVHICYYLDPVGNVKDDTVAAIMDSERYRQVKQKIAACRKNCQSIVNCNFDEEAGYYLEQDTRV